MLTLINKLSPVNRLTWLPLLAVFALPFGRTVEIFVLIMAILGIYDLIKDHNNVRQSHSFKLFSYFFLCFWLPGIISLFDAVNLPHSLQNVLGMLRFFFAGIFIINRISDYKSHLWLGSGIAITLLFWSSDAWLQLLTGTDILNLPPPPASNRISGPFGKYAQLGLMIIPFLGVAIAVVFKRLSIHTGMLFFLLVCSAILISGDRSSWISLFACGLFFILLFRPKNINITRKQTLYGLISVIVLSLVLINTPSFQTRLNSTLIAFDGGYKNLNSASAYRLPIWETSLRMFADNPINGVGVRSFRYAYPDYAKSDDPYVDFSLPRNEQQGQTHAHQLILELLSDTGLIGLIGYLLAIWMIFTKWLPIVYNSTHSNIAKGYTISLLAILFPINSHLSLYSAKWGQVVWLIVALTVSSICMVSNLKKYPSN